MQMLGLDKYRHPFVSIFSSGTQWTPLICASVFENIFLHCALMNPFGLSYEIMCMGDLCGLPHTSVLSLLWESFWRLSTMSLSFVPCPFCSLLAPTWMLIMQIHFLPLMSPLFLCYLPFDSLTLSFHPLPLCFRCVLLSSDLFPFSVDVCLSQKPWLLEFCYGTEIFLKFLLNPKIDPFQIWLFRMIFFWCADSTPTSIPTPLPQASCWA